MAELGDGALDLDRFERLRDEGRRELAAGRAAEAAACLREALELWRGRPLADLEHEHFARDAVARLEEARLEAIELRIDADLALGDDRELVAELRSLVRQHPLRERPRGQLMLALYRSGRQAEALAAYADARAALVGELGLEPGPELRRMQQAILDQDPELGPARRSPPSARRRRRAAGAGAVLATAALAVALALAGDDGTTGADSAATAVAPSGSAGRSPRSMRRPAS